MNKKSRFYVIGRGDSFLIDKADFVYSFAVFKHIGRLSDYERALRHFCKLAKVGGTLALNLHVQDYYDQADGKDSINFEEFSLCVDLTDLHSQHLNWSGVYIARRWLELCLRSEGVVIRSSYQHNAKVKPGNMWFICEKVSGDLYS